MTLSLLVLSLAAAEPSSGVVLNFTAKWCGPCQQMSPIVSRLQRQGHPIRKVDVDEHPALAKKYGVTAMPTFLLVVNAEEVHRIVGPTSEAELKRLMAVIPRGAESESGTGGTTERSKAVETGGRTPGIRIPLFGRRDESRDSVGEAASRPVQPAAPSAETGRLGHDEAPVIRAKYDRDDVTPTAAAAGDPMAASARIRIKDKSGINYGSATIIDSRPGRTFLLTCGHIFRDLPRDAAVEVDVFSAGGRFEEYVGRAIGYDLEADVGLLAIATETPLPGVNIAPPERRVAKGEQVFSIGCGGGEPPSRMNLQVTALNRYLGPDNIECTGVPQQGRSGGGLFGESGRLIGVCIAADPRDQRGLYCALPPIYALLDKARLSHLYRGSDAEPEPSRLAAAEPFASKDLLALAPTSGREDGERGRRQGESGTAGRGSDPIGNSSRLPVSPSSALARTGEAEVVCIIRPLDDPQAATRVVIINRASARFLSDLQGEMDDQPQATTYRVRPAETLFAEQPGLLASREPEVRSQRSEVSSDVCHLATDSSGETSIAQRYRRSPESRPSP